MGRKLYSPDILKEAIKAQAAWGQIDESLTIGNLSFAALAADIEAIDQMKHELAALQVELKGVRNRRDHLYLSIVDKVKRLRSGVKSLYGDDSAEYKLVGGTRRSERKKPRRTVVTEKND